MINVALVGCGGMANWHAQQILKLSADAKIVALVDPTPPHAQSFKEKYAQDAVVYETIETLLEKPPGQLDAVVIMTPHTLHYGQAKLALEKGVHVLVEKPMVTSSKDAYDLWETVKRTNKLLAITYQSPYTAEFGYLAAERDAGRLGKVQTISGWVSQGWYKGTIGKWRQDPTLSGGGYMYDTGAHMLNALMWLMNDSVTEVACLYDQLDTPVDINGVGIVRFQNGAFGTIGLAGATPVFRNDITLMTDTMLIHTDQYGAKLELVGRDGKKLYPHVPPLPEGAGTPHHNFVNAILGREPLKVPVRYGVLLSVLMDAMYESARSNKIVKVKPVPTDL
jgi:predicted dehydrogenase